MNRPPLKAQGNLSYLDFLRLVEYIWSNAHPDVPFVATTDKDYPTYPVIAYRLDFRKPMDNEPKPRYREEVKIGPAEDSIIISGQRFQNVITFTVYTQTNPHLAEEIIEQFEDFMMEFTPVFKELGLSDIFYVRRLPDNADQRPNNMTVVERSVSYMITVEKLITTSVAKLNRVLIDARVFMQTPFWLDQATPDYATPIIVDIVDTMGSATPPMGEFSDSTGIYVAGDN